MPRQSKEFQEEAEATINRLERMFSLRVYTIQYNFLDQGKTGPSFSWVHVCSLDIPSLRPTEERLRIKGVTE